MGRIRIVKICVQILIIIQIMAVNNNNSENKDTEKTLKVLWYSI